MSIRCWVFDHKMPTGYAGDHPYFFARGGVTDNIGREHWSLWAKCARCGTSFPVGYVHGPLVSAPQGMRARITYVPVKTGEKL